MAPDTRADVKALREATWALWIRVIELRKVDKIALKHSLTAADSALHAAHYALWALEAGIDSTPAEALA